MQISSPVVSLRDVSDYYTKPSHSQVISMLDSASLVSAFLTSRILSKYLTCFASSCGQGRGRFPHKPLNYDKLCHFRHQTCPQLSTRYAGQCKCLWQNNLQAFLTLVHAILEKKFCATICHRPISKYCSQSRAKLSSDLYIPYMKQCTITLQKLQGFFIRL